MAMIGWRLGSWLLRRTMRRFGLYRIDIWADPKLGITRYHRQLRQFR